jgi:hypothetical protein
MSTYHCIACGILIEMADGDTFPRDDERCSHEWEDAEDAAERQHEASQRYPRWAGSVDDVN